MATIELKLRPWTVPNFAVVASPPRPREEGMKPETSIPVSELSSEALRELASEWLNDLYAKAGKSNGWLYDEAD